MDDYELEMCPNMMFVILETNYMLRWPIGVECRLIRKRRVEKRMTNDEKERSSEDDHLKKMNTSSSEHNDIEQGKFFNLDTPLSLPLLVTWCGYTLL